MTVCFKKGSVKGKFLLPPSKSYIIRLAFCSLLSKKAIKILYKGTLCKDIENMLSCIEKIGANVNVLSYVATEFCEKSEKFGEITILPKKEYNQNEEINVGESGTAYAFFRVLNCFPGWNLKINCEGSLKKRDYSFCDVKISDKKITVDGKKSSQAVSASLICGRFLGNYEVMWKAKEASIGYVQMTFDVMREFSKKAEFTDKNAEIPTFFAENDWTAQKTLEFANFFGSEIGFESDNKEGNLTQPDSHFCIADIGDNIDINNHPDLIFAVAIFGAAKNIGEKTTITGAKRLKNKESDRFSGVVNFVNSLGGNAKINGDNIEIYGTKGFVGGEIDSQNDHRVVLAAWLAARIAKEDIRVTNAEAVSKSYPDFIRQTEEFEIYGQI